MKRFLLLFFAVLIFTSCNSASEMEKHSETIVPYVSKSKVYYSEYGQKRIVNSYGFCDLNGDVVIDPSDDISTLICYETDDGFSFYVVGLGQSEQSAYADGFDPTQTLIIPSSGEWCVELDEIGWWTVSAGDGGIFASLDYTTDYNGHINYIIEAKTLLYDYSGNLVKEFGKSTYISNYSKQYKNCVSIDLIEEENERRIYVNSKGELVENPEYIPYEYTPVKQDFENLPYAQDGYSFVDLSNDGNFLVYTVGEVDYLVSPMEYTIENDKRKAYILDLNTNEILHTLHGNCSARFVGNEDRFIFLYNSDNIEGGSAYNYCLYDTQKRSLVVNGAEMIEDFRADGNDYFAVSFKNSSILYDSEMNQIIKTYFE